MARTRRIGTDANFGLRLYAGTKLIFENSYALTDGDPFIDFVLPADGPYYIEVYEENNDADGEEYDLEIWRFQR